ncbi:MAG: hypothetical protein MUF29_04000 [Chitinophagaceae bacterium]|nr:hypothetical protein [Chitinophagaceae bacterium]
MNIIARHMAMMLRSIWMLAFILLWQAALAQPSGNYCKVKEGKFFIQLQKNISEEDLRHFTEKYDLYDLPLRDWLQGRKLDSLNKMGWVLQANTATSLAIAKKLESRVQDFERAAGREMQAVLHEASMLEGGWPVPQQTYGINKFRNRSDFAVQDSVVTFCLRGEARAGKVSLAGSFSRWQYGAFPMKKTDSGWIAHVILPPGKHWYKFIVDGRWMQDPDNLLQENDGKGNTNSVYYKTNWVFMLKGYSGKGKVFVAGSFNNWEPRKLEMRPGANGWMLPIYLPAGTHTYRFIANNNWMADPANDDRLPNEYNDFNSVVRIGRPYVFKLDGHAGAGKVVLSGSFNNWRTNELYMRRQGNAWILPYHLGPGNHEYRYIVDDKEVGVPDNGRGEPDEKANLFFVIEPNYTFRLKGYPQAHKVVLSGDFNNWSPHTYAMKREGNEWVLAVHLTPGKHRYKFLVDGQWITDPANTQWEGNEHGTRNSVMWFNTPLQP